ncbi:hypothetical protein E4582_03905 [Luteimonas yindakuii]|uniref:Uncharacterized protein n=1 Tax=Luteimonas yindakuii TaxID=2565782 RepID=A0A4Z1RIS6_9GAMM|nr:hypothetical protein [Luteimonas yindakuii]QCO67710.1 hypothetical protein E5843_07870 [Luteimonas yindakuii]TKS53999.1 hypothetical protein E4582_03905 [Luteimonas yindakuii]
MDRPVAHDDSNAPATAGALSCALPPDAEGAGAPGVPTAGRRRDDVLRRLEELAHGELELLLANRQQPEASPDLLASFIEWDLAVGA